MTQSKLARHLPDSTIALRVRPGEWVARGRGFARVSSHGDRDATQPAQAATATGPKRILPDGQELSAISAMLVVSNGLIAGTSMTN
jgi:hypothetical protein